MATGGRAGRWGHPFSARRLFRAALNEIDAARACRRRLRLGLRGRLVSWARQDDGSWLARLSGPDHDATVEHSGATRVAAIAGADRLYGISLLLDR